MTNDYRNVDDENRVILSLEEKKRKEEEKKKKLSSVREIGRRMGGVGKETNDRNTRIAAGFTFIGQFLGHDITRDSRLSFDPAAQDDEPPQNFRKPTLDLDSLYGLGPDGSPHLYDQERQGKFLLDEGKEFDLPRNSQGTALIADSRNDRNLILAQLHLAFLKFHNAVYDNANDINDGYKTNEGRFEKTKRLVQWHYQWIILREFLPLLVGPKMVFDILTKRPKWYEPKAEELFIPLEFSVAAYRFGHSQVHYLYRINDNFRLPIFSATELRSKRQDLRGGPITKAYAVNWKNFFETEAQPTRGWDRASKKINTIFSGPLRFPPPSVIQNRPEELQAVARKGLETRDLERGYQRDLLSGQEVAKIMEQKKCPVAIRDPHQYKSTFEYALAEGLKDLPSNLQTETPLLYYILKEAEVQHSGMMLGDVGGRIVAEVIIGLLLADKQSVIHEVDRQQLYTSLQTQCLGSDIPLEDFRGENRKQWKPVIPAQKDKDFTMVDLLKFAGVDIK